MSAIQPIPVKIDFVSDVSCPWCIIGLKALEQENSRLKRIVAEQAMDISMLKELQRGKW